MAREVLAVTPISRDGVDVTVTAGIADGHKFVNDGATFIEVKNNDASPRTITIITPQTTSDLAIEDKAVSVAAGETLRMGRYPPNIFNKQSGLDAGMVYIDYESGQETTFDVRIFRL